MLIILITPLLISTCGFIESCFQVLVEFGASPRRMRGFFADGTRTRRIHLQELKEKFCTKTPTTEKETTSVFRLFVWLVFHLNRGFKNV
jgi:hypothetical protein